MITTPAAIPLADLCRRITRAMAAAPGLTDVWVTAETSDVRTSGGHCYMELIQKDPETGSTVAKTRAVIWSSTYMRLGAAFAAATGTRLASDMKVMVRVSANYHAAFGFTLIINDINTDYTVGDLAAKRMRILARLQQEGVYDLNSSLPWIPTPNRIAVISAAGAAGYGDFVKHLHLNPYALRFDTTLFPAALQGERTVPSVIAALEAIMERIDDFDCVVIIRGGGAVSDLASFDDYDLAFNVAQFPLPVIVGIGHERDTTVLDYVANTRVKTPTAAAEVLIGRMTQALTRVRGLGNEILVAVSDRIHGQRQQLAYIEGTLPVLAQAQCRRRNDRLEAIAAELPLLATNTLSHRSARLDALNEVLQALSPEATLRRGYSITRVNGHAVTDASTLTPGTHITTTFAAGTVSAEVL